MSLYAERQNIWTRFDVWCEETPFFIDAYYVAYRIGFKIGLIENNPQTEIVFIEKLYMLSNWVPTWQKN